MANSWLGEFTDAFRRLVRVEILPTLGSVTKTLPLKLNGNDPIEITVNGKEELFSPVVSTSVTLNLNATESYQYEEFAAGIDGSKRGVPNLHYCKISVAGTCIFIGSIVTELYSEPHIRPPHTNIKVQASDGLNQLQKVKRGSIGNAKAVYAPGVKTSLKEFLSEILSDTGYLYGNKGRRLPLRTLFSLHDQYMWSPTDAQSIDFITRLSFEPEVFETEDGYRDSLNILSDIHQGFGARIYQARAQWWIDEYISLSRNDSDYTVKDLKYLEYSGDHWEFKKLAHYSPVAEIKSQGTTHWIDSSQNLEAEPGINYQEINIEWKSRGNHLANHDFNDNGYWTLHYKGDASSIAYATPPDWSITDPDDDRIKLKSQDFVNGSKCLFVRSYRSQMSPHFMENVAVQSFQVPIDNITQVDSMELDLSYCVSSAYKSIQVVDYDLLATFTVRVNNVLVTDKDAEGGGLKFINDKFYKVWAASIRSKDPFGKDHNPHAGTLTLTVNRSLFKNGSNTVEVAIYGGYQTLINQYVHNGDSKCDMFFDNVVAKFITNGDYQMETIIGGEDGALLRKEGTPIDVSLGVPAQGLYLSVLYQSSTPVFNFYRHSEKENRSDQDNQLIARLLQAVFTTRAQSVYRLEGTLKSYDLLHPGYIFKDFGDDRFKTKDFIASKIVHNVKECTYEVKLIELNTELATIT